jgi:hypothetical protein
MSPSRLSGLVKVVNSDEDLFFQTTITEIITIGNGSTMKAEKVGKLRWCVLQCNGRKFEITFENAYFLSDLWIK